MAAKIGIAVGAVATLILGAAGGWFWLTWRKHKTRLRGDAVELAGSKKIRLPRAGAHEADGRELPSELNAVPGLYEADGRERPAELNAVPGLYELSGS